MTQEVHPDPKLEKRRRRMFPAAERTRLLAEYDLLKFGQKGAWLRAQGLYDAQLIQWRRAADSESGIGPKTAGRKPLDAKDREIAQLKADNAKLTKRVSIAEGLVELQKKDVMALIESSSEASL
ncbi:transposase [bacterium]|nr:transposase [bacterium]